jgi:two-component system nitrate/nitrite sensor histidine kinase NarX
MAAEVHDSVAQSLAFVKMRLPLLRDAMQARDDPRARVYFDELRAPSARPTPACGAC